MGGGCPEVLERVGLDLPYALRRESEAGTDLAQRLGGTPEPVVTPEHGPLAFAQLIDQSTYLDDLCSVENLLEGVLCGRIGDRVAERGVLIGAQRLFEATRATLNREQALQLRFA